MKDKLIADKNLKAQVFIIEDHAMVREGFAHIIEQSKKFEVCGQASNAEDALKSMRSAKPDVVLVGIVLAGVNGLELSKKIRALYPKIRILIVSMHKESLYAERALRAGANGYLMKKESGAELLTAIAHVAGGKTYVSRHFNETLLRQVSGSGRKVENFSLDLLSDREVQVFQCVGQGWSTRQIGEELGISVKTVEAHKEHIRAKLNLRTNPEFVQYAIHWVHNGTTEP